MIGVVMAPFEQPETLVICVDLKDPYSHLAIPGTLALLERMGPGLTSRWLPFSRHAMEPPARDADSDRGSAHRRNRDQYRERELRYYAAAVGLPLERLYENPECLPFASALLWLAAAEASPSVFAAFLSGTFNAYWSGALAADDAAGCALHLTTAGADGAAWLDGGLDSAAVRQQHQALRDAGLFNSPAYLYQGEVYYGRAHLPLLETQISSVLTVE